MATGTAITKELTSQDRAIGRPMANGLRVLMYSHDTFGLGHLQRSLKLSRTLAARFPDISILLVTGSPVSHMYDFPELVDYVKLPSVRKIGPDNYEPRYLATSFERVHELRSKIVLNSVQSFKPHILLIDHSPIGMKGELLPTLKWVQSNKCDITTVLGLRDIVDSPINVARSWQEKGIFEILESVYDHIVVYGTKSVYDPLTAYNFNEQLKQKTLFCNYVGEDSHSSRSTNTLANEKGQITNVVVTIGGGDGAGEIVIGNFIKAINLFRDEVDFQSVIVTGPFLQKEQFNQFKKMARELPITLKSFTTSMAPLLKKSELVIATGGYNTITDVLCFAKKALIIPRVMHREEQRIRANRLKELGIVEVLEPKQVTPKTLYESIRTLLDNPAQPLIDARKQNLIPMDGATHLADFFGKLMDSILKRKVGK